MMDSTKRDYINRYAVLNVIDDAIANNALSYTDCVNEILEFIAKIPAADVKPVVHSFYEDDYLIDVTFDCCRCANCHWLVPRANYCLSCGADMRPMPTGSEDRE